MLSRRAFVAGGAATVMLAAGGLLGVDEGWLPGRVRLAQLTGRCDVDAAAPSGPAGELRSGRFASTARHRQVGWSLALPPGASPRGLPVVLVLHGRGVDHAAAFDQLRLHLFLAGCVRAGARPFALAAADGGDSYWHTRRDGDDPVAMLTHEFLPLLAGFGLRTTGVGVLGWSMGGYGALLLARESQRRNLAGVDVAVAAASSPALFSAFGASVPGAFDDASDFARYGALAGAPGVGSTPLYVACGADDAFTSETERYRRNVSPAPAGGISSGCHTDGYWRSVAGAQLAFLAANLG